MLWFCPLFFSRTCTNIASNFQLFTSYRRISPYPRHCLMVCSILSFCGEELLAPLPNPKLEEHPLSDVATAYSMYWQPPFIIKSFNFITSSCSLSPTVMRWTAFPFQGSSIVNRFLRRTDHSPNNEIFPMRPNNLTRCIFKTNVQNECWIRNKPNVYKHIHKHETNFKTTNQQRIKKATMYMRISTHSLTPERYKPCRFLADSRSLVHSSLSLALILQFITPSLSASLVTPSMHLIFGLPTRPLPPGLTNVIFLHGI